MKARLARIAHVLAAVTSIALPASVAADPYAIGPPSGGYRPDNSEHTYCRGSDYTGGNPRDAAHESMLRLQSQTTMTKNFVGDCSSAIDARFATGDLGGADGTYNCTDRSGSKCFHAVLTFDRRPHQQ